MGPVILCDGFEKDIKKSLSLAYLLFSYFMDKSGKIENQSFIFVYWLRLEQVHPWLYSLEKPHSTSFE